MVSRIGRIRAVIVLAASAIAVVSCTVDGQASAPEDLTPKAVSASAFPAGASRVPPQAVAGAVSDITGRPLRGSLQPAGCTPKGVRDAVVLVGLDPAVSTATYTSAIAHADDSLPALLAQIQGCAHYTSGSSPTASTSWTASILPSPAVPGGVTSGAVNRIGITGAISAGSVMVPMLNSQTTQTTTLMAQRDTVRIYVEYRWHTDKPMTSAQSGQLDALFQRAVTAAFG